MLKLIDNRKDMALFLSLLITNSFFAYRLGTNNAQIVAHMH